MLRLVPGAEAVLPDDLLAAYAPAQAPLSIEPCVAPPKVTERPHPHVPGGTLRRVEGHAGVSARYVGADQAIHPELSRCGHLVTFLRPELLRFGLPDWANDGFRHSGPVAAWPLLAPHQPELMADPPAERAV
jgi:hypothetical protein